MFDASLTPRERGSELVPEPCAALTRASSVRTAAFARLEEELGGELTRLLVDALARRRAARVRV